MNQMWKMRKFIFSTIKVKNYATKSAPTPNLYCLETVKNMDKENFLCTLLLDEGARAAAFAVRAFNIEIARIPDISKEKAIVDMRFKFWEDAIDAVFSKDPNPKIPNHPVTIELRKAIECHKLTKRYFSRLISSRHQQTHKGYFNTTDDLEKYAEDSVSSILYLLLEGSGIKNVNADHVASHIGKAQGICNTLRSLQHLAQTGHIILPRDLLLKYNISEEQIIRGNHSKDLKDAVFDLASKANYHLTKGRELKDQLPSESQRIFLPAVSVDLYLKRLRKHDFEVFADNLKKSNPILPFLLWWNNKFSKY